MADEKKPNEAKPKKPKKIKEPGADEGILTTTAKAIGTAAGKIAALAGVTEAAPKPHTKSTKPPKLQKKNNPHIPRKQKKAQKKAAAATLAKT